MPTDGRRWQRVSGRDAELTFAAEAATARGRPQGDERRAVRYPLTAAGAGTAKRIPGPTRPARSEEDEGRASANPSDAATWGTE